MLVKVMFAVAVGVFSVTTVCAAGNSTDTNLNSTLKIQGGMVNVTGSDNSSTGNSVLLSNSSDSLVAGDAVVVDNLTGKKQCVKATLFGEVVDLCLEDITKEEEAEYEKADKMYEKEFRGRY
ncbi:MAG: hypothetical protein LBI29_03765 [Rickettsiales bacterium]|jgi:ABC-type antimicrobial peptide transport system permease subunit|nr:hypothetical protein [Rickettsiales bacterium]